jgi:hypothetical protein
VPPAEEDDEDEDDEAIRDDATNEDRPVAAFAGRLGSDRRRAPSLTKGGQQQDGA